MTEAQAAYQAHIVDDRNELVVQELSTVYYVAAQIRERLPQHVEMEDLVGAGVLGLLEASRNFDPSKNAQFKTFAKFRIRGAILDSLREMDWGSRSLRKRGREIAEVTVTLQAKLGRRPMEEEIADEIGIDLDRLRKIVANLDSLNITGQKATCSADRQESMDLIESAPNGDPDPFDLCLQGEMKEHLADAIATLSEREQLILSLYYREELTMREIAEVVGVALSRVSQIRQASIQKLKQALQHIDRKPRASAMVMTGGGYAASC